MKTETTPEAVPPHPGLTPIQNIVAQGKRIRDLSDADCDALLGVAPGDLSVLSLQQRRILAAHAIAVGYGYGRVCVTVNNHKSRISTQLDDLLAD